MIDGNSPSATSDNSFTEREILYKIMFDLKQDMNDLKKFVLQMAKSGKYSTDQLNDILKDETINSEFQVNNFQTQNFANDNLSNNRNDNHIIINKDEEKILNTEVIEETLSLADMEKRMIIKALEKYNGKRKKAANELEISERTLYRKIKEYSITL